MMVDGGRWGRQVVGLLGRRVVVCVCRERGQMSEKHDVGKCEKIKDRIVALRGTRLRPGGVNVNGDVNPAEKVKDAHRVKASAKSAPCCWQFVANLDLHCCHSATPSHSLPSLTLPCQDEQTGR